MPLLKLFQMVPQLSGTVRGLMLLAVALVGYGLVSIGRRRVARGLVCSAGGVLALWWMASMLVDGASPPPSAADEKQRLRVASLLVGLCIAGGGAAAVAGAFAMLNSARRFFKTALSATGRIVEFTTDRHMGPDGKTVERYFAVIAFQASGGQEHRVESQSVGRTLKQLQLDLGRKVSVLYDPDNPSDARTGTSLQLWIVPLLVGLLGLLLLAAGLAVAFVEPG